MLFKKYKTKNNLIRCFTYSNLHEISCKLEKLTLLYVQKNNISLKALIKISTFLELISSKRSFFIRSKKSFAALKLRKGAPVGAKITLRNQDMFSFLFKLI
jgi:large subunit ribosomal protein L5